ncbi:pantoate--beta-alanine ligase [Deinococcus rubellus]|uniref:Pantothenate synthetase n=1 Tax=Deinococcus rubellus TaxID=1889240 RepID=A0ABY5YPH4_9DEIO|nr:pantoate--beta-alanine ligase [Deinococcus rubellus]UWX65618.1 pantoate--beta-alanine ligase [Deinococcus rubellus]
MQLVHTPAELRAALGPGGSPSLGLVPTMGHLHDGHAHLIRRARAENDRVVLSLFVNPLQFGPSEDFAAYPRDLPHDAAFAERAGVDVLFAPDTDQMYPPGFATRVSVAGVSEGFDGASRPGHFSGVATVVLKLFNLVQPTRAYFGEKDWQQLMVVRRMVRDLDLLLEIVGVPTVRSSLPGEEGLALSSRNSYFTPPQRARAAVLARALGAAQQCYAAGERRPDGLLAAARAVLVSEPDLTLDYLGLVDGDMRDIEQLDNGGVSIPRRSDAPLPADAPTQARLLVAAHLFGVRLIDNLPLTVPATAPAAVDYAEKVQ